MQKYILSTIVIISVIMISGCINPIDNGDVKTLNQNGISINYPANWRIANSNVNETIASVGNPAFIDNSTDLTLVSVTIQKRELPSSLKEYYNQTYDSFSSNYSFKSLSSENLTLGNYNGLGETYTVTEDSGLFKQYRAVWIENKGNAYVILATAPKNDFKSQELDFNSIINSFKITE